MRVKMFELRYQETLEKFEDQVNALLAECEKQWEVVDADILVESSLAGKGNYYLLVKYSPREP